MSVNVDLLGLHEYSLYTGIGRYVNMLLHHMPSCVSVRVKAARLPPLSGWFTFLRNLPLGVRMRRSGSILHFPQIMGCGMMIWNPQRPAVATVHDLGVLEMPEEWRTLDPVGRQVLRLSLAGLKRVDLIIAVSEVTRQGVIGHLGFSPERVMTVHSGIDYKVFCPIGDAESRLRARYPRLADCSRPWLLYVGSELPRKNLDTLFETILELKGTYPGIHLLKVGAAGGDSFRVQTKAFIENLVLEGRVLFFERVTDEELALFYNAVDVLVQPSRLEGFGFPVLEAMSCGSPVVCSRAGSLPEIAGDAALMVEPQDVDALAQTIGKVLEDRDLATDLGARGISRASAFTWARTAQKVADIYHGF